MTWVEKYGKGNLIDELQDGEKVRKHDVHIAPLERKVGQLVMELDTFKEGEIHRVTSSEPLNFESRRGAVMKVLLNIY